MTVYCPQPHFPVILLTALSPWTTLLLLRKNGMVSLRTACWNSVFQVSHILWDTFLILFPPKQIQYLPWVNPHIARSVVSLYTCYPNTAVIWGFVLSIPVGHKIFKIKRLLYSEVFLFNSSGILGFAAILLELSTSRFLPLHLLLKTDVLFYWVGQENEPSDINTPTWLIFSYAWSPRKQWMTSWAKYIPLLKHIHLSLCS